MLKAVLAGLLGLGLIAAGAFLGVSYLIASAPGAPVDVIKAVAVVTSTRTEQMPIGPSKISQAKTLTFERFVFTDANGVTHGGEDEVSDVFLLAHPVGSQIEVFFAPGNPDHAFIGLPQRVQATANHWEGIAAVLLLGMGAFVVVAATDRALRKGLGHGLLA